MDIVVVIVLLLVQRSREAFDMVLRLGRNSTLTLLREEFPGLGSGANNAATQLFLEMSLYILGSDANVDDMVTSFFSRLFPLAYRRLLGNGAAAGISDECMHRIWREVSAFGSYPKLMMTRLSRSLLATRLFLQALNLGIEVVNTTQHLKAGRECGRALLRLWYCPLCQGLMEARPCKAMCLVTMSTCLGGAAEVQPHWRTYVEGLGTLAAAMRGGQDIEAVVLRLHVIIRMALRHIVGTKNRVNAQVSSMCSRAPQRKARAVTSQVEPALVIQPVNFDPDETLSGQRREFILSLRGFSFFYANLGETLCSREPAALNGSLCWNGQEMTDKFFNGLMFLEAVKNLILEVKVLMEQETGFCGL
ncbi:Glypican-3 [Bagarius yarrelli]|uniref:Glypican-3 n=1 Tax=Bagarius yarrelli TaxID=175774 RepID=A0A556UXT0_BAGYA|nr:Glypican-3 [Bagarius yarrelli]